MTSGHYGLLAPEFSSGAFLDACSWYDLGPAQPKSGRLQAITHAAAVVFPSSEAPTLAGPNLEPGESRLQTRPLEGLPTKAGNVLSD